MSQFQSKDPSNKPFNLFDDTFPAQSLPQGCVLCQLLDDEEVKHLSFVSMDLTGSECESEICQKKMCLPNIRPTAAEKELSPMPKFVNVDPSTANPDLNRVKAAEKALPLPVADDIVPANQPKSALNDQRDRRVVVNDIGHNNLGQNDISSLDVGSLHVELSELKARVQMYEESTLTMRRQIQGLSDQLVNLGYELSKVQPAIQQRRLVEPITAPRVAPPSPQKRRPEPAMQPSTYTVRRRASAGLLGAMTGVVPFSLLMVLFGMALSMSVALVYPGLVPFMGLDGLIAALLQAMSVLIAFSLAIAFVLELRR
ncbi:MAG: hypothetical protein WA885_15880 [Phormidesmis sp.]